MKYFTPAEASNTLPLVSKIVKDILLAGQKIRHILQGSSTDSSSPNQAEYELESLFQELSSIGCEYKDWNYEIGLIDFPAIIDGQKVYLCWRSDEPKLLYYHGVYEGYAGRKLIPKHLLENKDAESNIS